MSEGRRYAGMEHWLPLYYEELDTVFDQIENFRIVTDHTLEEAARERSNLIEDYYEARKAAGSREGARRRNPRPTSQCRRNGFI